MWYSFETFSSDQAQELRAFLKSCGIKYELSGVGAGWHFEIYGSTIIKQVVNNWLDNYTE